MEKIDLFFEEMTRLDMPPLGGFALAFIISYLAIPPIIAVARAKLLYEMPNGRTSHSRATPMLGGIAIFAGMLLSTIIHTRLGFEQELKYLIAGLVILFFVGVKDDILVLDPKKKLLAQVIAALLIVVLGDIRVTDFHGFLGIHEVSYFVSLPFTVFLFIVVTNGFNLVDGIDGLAAGTGIVTASFFGLWFTLAGHESFAVLAFSLVGALAAFFYFNVFSRKNKIFLGDTGSLVLGFTVAVFVIRFLEYEIHATGRLVIESTPAVAFGILIIPMYDTLRVFALRISRGRSPFAADKQHIHHRLLDLGFTHLQATMTLLGLNAVFIILSIALQHIGNVNLVIVQLSAATLLSYLMMRALRKKCRCTPGMVINGYHVDTMEPGHRITPATCPVRNVPCPMSMDPSHWELIGYTKDHIKTKKETGSRSKLKLRGSKGQAPGQ